MSRFLASLAAAAVLVASGPASAERRGRARVTSTPSGAAVFVDGASEPTGHTPTWLTLPRGEHSVRVVQEGFAPEERDIEIGRRRILVRIDLTALVPLEVTAVDESASGASVLVDGVEVGTVPFERMVPPGRHLLAVHRDGFEPFRRWVELEAGRGQSVSVVLEAEAPLTGSILVAGNVPGAPVFVDEEEMGRAPLVLDLAPGRHIVEIRPEGLDRHAQVVLVEAGHRITVSPSLQPPPREVGTLVVVTDPPGARVSLDGQLRGMSPLTLDDVSPGAHIVEARAEERQDALGRATVEAGRQESVHLVLSEEVMTGSVRVTSTVVGSEVLVDGVFVGTAPAVREGLSRGEHVVVVRAPGHSEWSHRFIVDRPGEVAVNATPGGLGRLTVLCPTSGAVVLLDGEEIGQAPIRDREVASGEHLVEVRAEGHVPFTARVVVEAGTTAEVAAELPVAPAAEAPPAPVPLPEDDGPAPPPWHGRGSEFATSAIPLRPYRLTLSGAWGWPFLVGTYRVAVGVYDNMDVAVEARSSYFSTEFDAHLRYGFRFARIVGIGGEVSVGGGFGNEGRNTALLGIVLWEGLELGPVAIALRQRLQVFWDRFDANEDRQVSARVFVGASLEWRAIGPLYVFFIVDYAPYVPAQPARNGLCGGTISPDGGCTDWMHDINLDARLGLGVTFF